MCRSDPSELSVTNRRSAEVAKLLKARNVFRENVFWRIKDVTVNRISPVKTSTTPVTPPNE